MGDYFKIVAHMKKNRIDYCYVPHQWEKGNILYWPQANLNVLRADPSSRPETDWKQYNCKLKKTFIFGKQEAELWEEQFVEEGTDVEAGRVPTKQPKKLEKNNQPSTPASTSFDMVFENINKEPVIVYSNSINPETDSQELSSNNIPINIEIDPNIIIANNLKTNDEIGINTATIIQENMLQKLNSIYENQLEIIQNQQRITQRMDSEFTQQKATYDKLYSMMKEMKFGNSNAPDRNEEEEVATVTFANLFKLPLSTIEEVLAFNREIGSNKGFENYLVKCYTSIGGTDGNEEGKIIAKKLRAIFFTEHVLTLFSWTGMSRTPGIPKKESFQICENIVRLFLNLISAADNRWSSTKNERFFKYNTLKHAKQIEKAIEKKKKGGAKEQTKREEQEIIQEQEIRKEQQNTDIELSADEMEATENEI